MSLSDRNQHIHLIGICGTAMGAFAHLLHQLGYRLSGSDANPYPPMSTQLVNLGVQLYNGYRAENLTPRPDRVVVGNVVRRDNPEALAATAAGIPMLSMPQAVAELSIRDNHSIVVAGTHGKTTTSALVAWCLHHAGLSPGFLIGGETRNFKCNSALGRPGYFVVEGDEYDTAYFDKGPKFLHYRPRSAIITSVEFDHADIYRDIEHVKESFRRFISLLPAQGTLVACTDYPHLSELLTASPIPPVTYGLQGNGEFSGYIEESGPDGMRFVITRTGQPIANLQSPLLGRHNLLNQIAAVVLLRELGLSMDILAEGLATFTGVRRRQEVFAVVRGITLIDDFAHHPTAVQVTIDAIRLGYPGRRLWAVFEPRSATSRRRVFQDRYIGAFSGADRVLIADVYNSALLPDEDRFSPEELVSDLTSRGVEARTAPTVEALMEVLRTEALPGDVILIMSNGGFGGIYTRLPVVLAEG